MWSRLLSAALGVWLMAAPAVLPTDAALRTSDRIAGPVAAALSIVAVWQVTRALRWAVVPVGLWLVIAPVVLRSSGAGAVNSVIVGALLLALAWVRGPVTQSYGGGWASLARRTPPGTLEKGASR